MRKGDRAGGNSYTVVGHLSLLAAVTVNVVVHGMDAIVGKGYLVGSSMTNYGRPVSKELSRAASDQE